MMNLQGEGDERRRFYLLILQRTTAIVPPKDRWVNFLFSRYDLFVVCFLYVFLMFLLFHIIRINCESLTN